MKTLFIGEQELTGDAKLVRRRIQASFRRAMREQAAAERALRLTSLRQNKQTRLLAENQQLESEEGYTSTRIVTKPDGSRVAVISYMFNGQTFTKSVRLSDTAEQDIPENASSGDMEMNMADAISEQ